MGGALKRTRGHLRCRYKEIMEKAPEEFKEYASCLDNYGYAFRWGITGFDQLLSCMVIQGVLRFTPLCRLRFARCRDKQMAFEKAFPVSKE